MILQLPGTGGLFDNPMINLLVFYVPFIFLLLYGQKFQTMIILSQLSGSVHKLKSMKDRARKEAIDYVTLQSKSDASEKIDRFLEYFTIMPVDMDPSGIVKKVEHLMTTRDDRMRAEVKSLAPSSDSVKTSSMENLIEVATALNFIYKIVRHFYLLGRKTNSLIVIVQLQAIMPLILQEAEALVGAVEAMKLAQPIGDGIGAMVAGNKMLGLKHEVIAKDTIICEREYNGRTFFVMKAEGPAGNVGEPGTALRRLVEERGHKFDTIIMVDAALKMEGEKTGDIAEGIGAAIGGIGVDRYKIEEVAVASSIPLYAIVVKQSIIDAISVMKKEIAEAKEKVDKIVDRLIEEKTKVGNKVLLIGVGNTLGVGQ